MQRQPGSGETAFAGFNIAFRCGRDCAGPVPEPVAQPGQSDRDSERWIFREKKSGPASSPAGRVVLILLYIDVSSEPIPREIDGK